MAAARAWWLLRWGGLADVRLLDGGLDAWLRAGGSLESGDVVPEPGDVDADRRRHAGADHRRGRGPAARPAGCSSTPGPGSGTAARSSRSTRAPGTCPARVSAPTTENLDARRHVPAGRGAGPTGSPRSASRPGAPVGVYCGSGVTAAHEVAALAVAGVEAALYAGLVVAVVERPGPAGRYRRTLLTCFRGRDLGGPPQGCAPALADLEGPAGGAAARSGSRTAIPSVDPWGHDVSILWLWDTDGGSGTGIWLGDPDEDPSWALFRATEVIQQAAHRRRPRSPGPSVPATATAIRWIRASLTRSRS